MNFPGGGGAFIPDVTLGSVDVYTIVYGGWMGKVCLGDSVVSG